MLIRIDSKKVKRIEVLLFDYLRKDLKYSIPVLPYICIIFFEAFFFTTRKFTKKSTLTKKFRKYKDRKVEVVYYTASWNRIKPDEEQRRREGKETAT